MTGSQESESPYRIHNNGSDYTTDNPLKLSLSALDGAAEWTWFLSTLDPVESKSEIHIISHVNITVGLDLNNTDSNNSHLLPFDYEDEEYPFDKPYVRIIFIVLYSIVFCFCFFGNLAVVLVVTLHWKMRSITKFCLGNLAFANLCVGIFCVYQNLSTFLMDNWVFGHFLCKMYHFTNSLSHTASILILVVICVERYLAILHPFRCRQILTMQRLRVVIVAVWILSAILCSPKLYYINLTIIPIPERGPDEPPSFDIICAPQRTLYDSQTADGINFTLLFLFPLIVISVLYTKVGLVLWKSSSALSHAKNPGGRAGPGSPFSDRGNTSGVTASDCSTGAGCSSRHSSSSASHNSHSSSSGSNPGPSSIAPVGSSSIGRKSTSRRSNSYKMKRFRRRFQNQTKGMIRSQHNYDIKSPLHTPNVNITVNTHELTDECVHANERHILPVQRQTTLEMEMEFNIQHQHDSDSPHHSLNENVNIDFICLSIPNNQTTTSTPNHSNSNTMAATIPTMEIPLPLPLPLTYNNQVTSSPDSGTGTGTTTTGKSHSASLASLQNQLQVNFRRKTTNRNKKHKVSIQKMRWHTKMTRWLVKPPNRSQSQSKNCHCLSCKRNSYRSHSHSHNPVHKSISKTSNRNRNNNHLESFWGKITRMKNETTKQFVGDSSKFVTTGTGAGHLNNRASSDVKQRSAVSNFMGCHCNCRWGHQRAHRRDLGHACCVNIDEMELTLALNANSAQNTSDDSCPYAYQRRQNFVSHTTIQETNFTTTNIIHYPMKYPPDCGDTNNLQDLTELSQSNGETVGNSHINAGSPTGSRTSCMTSSSAPPSLSRVRLVRQNAIVRSSRLRNSSGRGIGHKRRKRREKFIEPRQAVVRMLITIVVTFAICNLPYHLRKICQNYNPNYNFESNFSYLITPLTFLFMYINCAINPILYAFMSKNFRSSFKDLLKCRLKKAVPGRKQMDLEKM